MIETAQPSLREAFGRFATGVAFVTADGDGSPLGLIVSSFVAVSLQPPLISFCPARDSLTWRRMRSSERFAVNVLGSWHADFASANTAIRYSSVESDAGFAAYI